ncbi:hypothetical protein HA402_008729 [Bradysia odoriphaga]|nr:hypothetical protein HA402_008729 [Bradysia odoriphaga]
MNLSTKPVIYLLLLISITGTFSLDFKSDMKYQNEWVGLCRDGYLQSPIAIPNACGRSFLKHLNIKFINMHKPVKYVEVTNAGRQVVCEFDRFEVERAVIIEATNDIAPFSSNVPYILQNIHFHHGRNNCTGTLHSLNGNHYFVEAHILFTRKEFHRNVSAGFTELGNTLEMVVLLELSDTHNRDWTVLNNLMLSKNLKESEKLNGIVNLNLLGLIPKYSTYSLHHGSLPASGCSEVITWIVFDKPLKCDTNVLAMRLYTYISDGKEVPLEYNTRHIQSRNDRPVYQGRQAEVSYYEQNPNTKPKEVHLGCGCH